MLLSGGLPGNWPGKILVAYQVPQPGNSLDNSTRDFLNYSPGNS
jgi:hypothetical protein